MLEVIITKIKFVHFILLNKCLYIDVLHTLFLKIYFFLKLLILCALFNNNKVNPESLPCERYRHLHKEFKEQSF